jgi:hypothetical protein
MGKERLNAFSDGVIAIISERTKPADPDRRALRVDVPNG